MQIGVYQTVEAIGRLLYEPRSRPPSSQQATLVPVLGVCFAVCKMFVTLLEWLFLFTLFSPVYVALVEIVYDP